MSQDLPARTRLTLAAQNKSVVSIAITSSDAEGKFAIDREDFTEETMALANAQAVGVTEESKSRYGLTIGGQIKSLQHNGYPAVIENNGPGGRNTFSDEFTDPKVAPALATFEGSSNSKILGLNVIKGRALPVTELDVDYLNLLREVSSDPGGNRLAMGLEKFASENNGTTSKKPYLTIGQKEKNTTIGKMVLQNELGVHVPKNNGDSRTSVEVQLQTLKNLGLQMLLKSSGEFSTLTNEEDAGQVLLAKASSMAPGLARLGAKIPLSSLQPESMVREVNPDFIQRDSSLLSQDDVLTYGSYNSPLVPFDSIDSRSSLAASAILIATLSLLFEALSRVFDPKSGLQSPLFNSITNQVNNICVNTQNNYTDCVRVGMSAFFGNGSENLGQIIGTGFNRLNEAPGYYNTILRNLVRSLTYEFGQALFAATVPPGVIDGIVGPLDTNSAGNLKPAGLSMDVGANIVKAFARISQSRVVGFMNVLANIGDIHLSLRASGMTLAGEEHRVGSLENQIIDITSNGHINPASFIRKNRLSSDASKGLAAPVNQLAWGVGTTPSKFILPGSIIVAGRDLGGSDSLVAKLHGERGFDSGEVSRLTIDQVKDLEDELDASYVPFYFHDLRTNEIISFHAFLSEMTDGFTAEYNETTGYGRIGKIYTYKNTDRAISLGFSVVATNDTDFQRMWWKINKLVTLVYPQYTAGRILEHEGQKFTQPFSQLPSASPLIRLRLGDVWKSNYSKFGLARLFGLGQGQDKFSLNQENVEREQTNEANYRTALVGVRELMSRNIFDVDQRFLYQYTAPSPRRSRRVQDSMPHGVPADSYILQLVEEPTAPVAGATPVTPLTSGQKLLRVVAVVDERATVDAQAGTSQGAGQAVGTEGPGNRASTLYKVKFDDAPSNQRNIQYYLRLQHEVGAAGSSIALYEPDVTAWARRQAPAASGSVGSNTTDLVQDFFKSEGENANPIFQAFESTAGKGLAGFMKSLKLDWNESPWSTDSYNGKAPMMLKVTMDFAPIHDISPGIDNNGFNTAPVYRVGDISDAMNTSVGAEKTVHDARVANYSELNGALTTNPNRGIKGGST